MLLEGVTHCLGAKGLVDVRLDGEHGPAVAKVVEVEDWREFIRNGLEDRPAPPLPPCCHQVFAPLSLSALRR